MVFSGSRFTCDVISLQVTEVGHAHTNSLNYRQDLSDRKR